MKDRRQTLPRGDALASVASVSAILKRMIETLPELNINGEKEMISLLRAIRYAERKGDTDQSKGRKGRFSPQDISLASRKLGPLLERGTFIRETVTLPIFTDHYLRILSFPKDLQEGVESGKINLYEAVQLARLNAEKLGISESEARRKREEVLRAYLLSREGVTRLKTQIDEIFSPPSSVARDLPDELVQTREELQSEWDLAEVDMAHIFYDQMTQVCVALREAPVHRFPPEAVEEILEKCDEVLLAISKATKKSAPRERVAWFG